MDKNRHLLFIRNMLIAYACIILLVAVLSISGKSPPLDEIKYNLLFGGLALGFISLLVVTQVKGRGGYHIGLYMIKKRRKQESPIEFVVLAIIGASILVTITGYLLIIFI